MCKIENSVSLVIGRSERAKFPVHNSERTEPRKKTCGNIVIATTNSEYLKHKVICEKHFRSEDIFINNVGTISKKSRLLLKTEETSY